MTINLTDEEATTMLKFVDLGLKSEGIGALGAANMIIQKINHAKSQPVPVAVPEPAAAVGG